MFSVVSNDVSKLLSPLVGFAPVLQGWLYFFNDVNVAEGNSSVGAFQPQFPQKKVWFAAGKC